MTYCAKSPFQIPGQLSLKHLVVLRSPNRKTRLGRRDSRRGLCRSCEIAEKNSMADQEKKQKISNAIRGVPDFPKKGILFWDITTLLLDNSAFKAAVDLFVDRYKDQKIDGIAALESRGFVIGAPVALELGVPLILMRKPNKLPGNKISETYELEYGSDTIEMHVDAIKPGQRIVIVDDLIATGGTLRAAINLIKKLEAIVVEACVIVELPDLKGRQKLEDTPLFVLIEKEGL